jgi:hypothetical protein
MLLTFTDANTGNAVAINPTQVVCVFTGKNDDGVEQTVINLLNGNIVVGEDYLTVVGQLQGQLK